MKNISSDLRYLNFDVQGRLWHAISNDVSIFCQQISQHGKFLLDGSLGDSLEDKTRDALAISAERSDDERDDG